MTLALKEWIDKVTTISKLLKDITSVETISIAANASGDVSFNNSEKGVIFGAGGGNSKIVALVNTTTTGACSSLKVAGATNMTITNGTNKVTIVNGYAYGMSALVIRWL